MKSFDKKVASRASLIDQKNQKSYTLDGRKIIGRSFDADIKIEGSKVVSKQHAEIFFQENHCYIRDLSSNGTKVNGVKIPKEQSIPINNQDQLDIVGHHFIFEIFNSSETKTDQNQRSKNNSTPPPPYLARYETAHDYEDYSQYETAGFLSRGCANIVDTFMVIFPFYIAVGILLFVIEDKSIALTYVKFNRLGMLLLHFYFIFLPLKKSGQTFGKKLFKLKVIYLNNQDQLTTATIVKREYIVKLIEGFIIPIIIILYFMNSEKRAFHDILASTRVIKLN